MDDTVDAQAPTELAPSPDPTEAIKAWSLVDDEPPPPRLSAGRITALAVAGALALIAGSGVLAAYHLRSKPEPVSVPAVAQTATPSPSSVVASPPPPPPAPVTTVVVSTVVAAAPPAPPNYPQLLADELRKKRWRVWNAEQLGEVADFVCMKFWEGWTYDRLVHAMIYSTPSKTLKEATEFTDAVMVVYPDCVPR